MMIKMCRVTAIAFRQLYIEIILYDFGEVPAITIIRIVDKDLNYCGTHYKLK